MLLLICGCVIRMTFSETEHGSNMVTSRQRRFFIPRLVNIMTEMRTLTELHREWEETLNMDWSREFQIPPLLYEIASV